MARPPKKGIDYAGWSVNIFDSDTKIDKLIDAQGWSGFGIYFYLCQRAYGSEGYFYKWCYDDCASTSRKMGGGISAGTVKETVDYCLRIGLFDKGLFDRWEVLTSRGIQRRYWEVVKERDVRCVISDYWLLHESECKGLIKIPLNGSFQERNPSFPSGNVDFPERNHGFPAINESKEKESKGKQREWSPQSETRFNEFCQLYPKKVTNILTVSGEYTYILHTTPSLTEDDLIAAVKNYAESCRILKTNERYIKNPENWLKDSTWISYLPENYKKPEAEKKQNMFNQFQQNDYDFEELEKKLLSN